MKFVALAVVLMFVGCDQGGDCETVCKRVAACRENARKSPEKVLGEKDPPKPDPKCMNRCKNHHEEWTNCEKRERTCDRLRMCYGELR